MIRSSLETKLMHHHPVLLFRLRSSILAVNLGKGIVTKKCFVIIFNTILGMVYMAREVYSIHRRELGKSEPACNGQEFKIK